MKPKLTLFLFCLRLGFGADCVAASEPANAACAIAGHAGEQTAAILVATVPFGGTAAATTTEPLVIGDSAGGGLPGLRYRGLLDGVALWKRPLSEAEIAARFDARGTSLPPPIAETQPGEILFCERNPGRDYARHYYANFGYDCGNENFWLYGADGGRLAIYSPMTGSVRTLLADAAGAVRDPQIHYDGKRVLFSYRKTERTTIRLWLDSATPYAGTAAAFGTGQIGGWWRNNEPVREMADAWPTTGPAKDAIQRRCTTCHERRLPRFVTDLTTGDPYNDFEGWERPVSRFSRHTIFNLTHPDRSLALTVPLAKSAGGFAEGPLPNAAPVPEDLSRAPKPIVHGVVFASTDDPDYRAVLPHLQAARDRLNVINRFDMPGFKPAAAYIREMKRYGILAAEFDAEKKDVDTYDLDRKYWQQFWFQPIRPTE